MGISQYDPAALGKPAWNAGKQVGVKKPLKQRQIWAVRFFLDREGRMRDRALFDLAIDSKLRGCDLVKLKIGTLVTGHEIRSRAMVVQQKTGRPVQFEITSEVRASLLAWLQRRGGTVDDYAFPSRVDHADHLSTRQYARLVRVFIAQMPFQEGCGSGPRPVFHHRRGPLSHCRSSTSADTTTLPRHSTYSKGPWNAPGTDPADIVNGRRGAPFACHPRHSRR